MDPLQKHRLVVHLRHGSVTLREWSAVVADAYLYDLTVFTMAFAAIRAPLESGERPGLNDVRRSDLAPEIWGAFWRLVIASLEGCTLPKTIHWTDRQKLLEAMWQLNDLDEAEGKMKASIQRAARVLARAEEKRQRETSTSS